MICYLTPIFIIIIYYIISKIRHRFVDFWDEVKGINHCAWGILLTFLAFGYPIDLIQLIAYIIVILLLYIWCGEWFPLVKVNLRYRKLAILEYDADTALTAKVVSDTFSLEMSEMIYLILYCIKIYPVFGFLFFNFRFIVKKLAFKDHIIEKGDINFYKNWNILHQHILIYAYTITGIISVIFSLIYLFSSI